MNILIPHTWLLEHLETEATPPEIQKYLSLCGPSIERIHEIEGEPVYDIEVTTNRVDMMSVRGIAREAAVILPQFGVAARLKTVAQPDVTVASQAPLQVPAIINNPELCQRIHCVVLDAVDHTPTPEWMAKRLRQIDQMVHDSVIDITNYVTHELGHPCHAFDYDKIMQLGGEIRVVEATAGQPFVTLDGEKYETKGGEVVFKNPAGDIIDLPAIKGTQNTSVDNQTQRVLLWIESIPAKKVRTTSMSHAIRTVAAQLNEKNVDPHLAEPTLARGVELYQELCGAQVASPVYDDFPGETAPATVTVKLAQIAAYLGVELPITELTELLNTLECQVEATESELRVTPPTFRPDIAIPADVIEEIARIYGYHRLPSVLMPTAIPQIKPEHTTFDVEQKIKTFLAHIGWQEVYTYSMVSEELAQESGYPLDEHLKLANPLTDDRVYLRRSLIPSLCELIANNPQRPQLSVFEIACVYEPATGDIPHQPLQLALVSTAEYRTVRGAVEALLDSLFVTGVTIKPVAAHATEATIVAINREGTEAEIGRLQVLPAGQTAITIPLDARFLSVVNTHPSYQPLAKTSMVYEDFTFTIPEGVAVGTVLDTIKNQDALVQAVELSDTYQRNFTFRVTFHDPNRNLSVAEVEPVRKQIVQQVLSLPGVTLVGAV